MTRLYYAVQELTLQVLEAVLQLFCPAGRRLSRLFFLHGFLVVWSKEPGEKRIGHMDEVSSTSDMQVRGPVAGVYL